MSCLPLQPLQQNAGSASMQNKHAPRRGLAAYAKSGWKAFGTKTSRVRHIHPAGKRDRDNGGMEGLSA